MTLTPGTRLGTYDILAVIGAGGMGEVFRARDTRLQRDIALKVLPESFGRDPDRLARFRREALVLAGLNHPNIATIFGVEESADTLALVLELVDGRRWPIESSRGRFSSTKSCPSRHSLRTPWNLPTRGASFIAIWSPRISRSGPTVP